MPFPLLHRLPISARLPLAMAVIVLVTAFGSTQIATRSLSGQVEVQLQRMGQIYLDGLAASLMPSVLGRDASGIDRALAEALRMHQGLQERRLLLLDAQGGIVARVDRGGVANADMPHGVRQQPSGYWLDTEDGSYWVWRPLADERIGPVDAMTVVANLDVSDYVAERRALWLRVVAFDLGLGILCAILGVFLLRRLLQPVHLLTRHLQQGQDGAPLPLDEQRVPPGDHEALQLVRAYNRMADAARDREAMLVLMARQEREAVLGRMAATLAHEVRNPLAGVTTVVETLRKFGDRPEVRAEALDFMERGMRALTEVTNATLATHRSDADTRWLGPQDLIDVCRLVTPHAERAGVRLQVDMTLQETVPVAAGEVRQVLLNLLLNAVNASAPGSTVGLHCRLHESQLRLEVSDQGAGLPADMARSLEQGAEPRDGSGLGVAVIVRLVQQLRGRVAVDAHSGRGTRIVLDLPLDGSDDLLPTP